MTKAQRRAMYLEAARAVLEECRPGLYSACYPLAAESTIGPLPELDMVALGAFEHIALPADLRAMLLILAATI